MIKFILICLALMPRQVFANFTGTFAGHGQATMHPKEKVRSCTNIYFQIEQTDTQLHVIAAGYQCQDLEAEFPEFTMDIKGDQLVSDGGAVGTITESEITLYTENVDEDFTYKMQLLKVNDTIQFLENWTDGGTPALTVQGTMKGR